MNTIPVPEQRPPCDDQLASTPPAVPRAISPDAREVSPVVLQPVFRDFSIDDFTDTSTWERLEPILDRSGGCYGLYGPRGSGKTWLMQRAIHQADNTGGLGLRYPCPRRYDSNAFLSTLSANLAYEIEHRFAANSWRAAVLRNGARFLLGLLVIPVTVGVITYLFREPVLAHTRSAAQVAAATLPDWLWALVAVALALLILLYSIRFIEEKSPIGSLVREAANLSERIRYSTALKLGTEINVSGSKALAAAFSRSREKSLDERPTTVASLVHDFRSFAKLIAETLHGDLVIGIDELDKVENIAAVRTLLRDIKGIFEDSGARFLVSISEAAATALQLGPLKADDQNEFGSSFYTVIELPPLDPAGAVKLLNDRGLVNSARLARALCVLSGGSRRELIRMADFCVFHSNRRMQAPDERAIVALLERESYGLLSEIITSIASGDYVNVEEDPKYNAWTALPRDKFSSTSDFVRLGLGAIREFWTPLWSGRQWTAKQEPWRRLLVRLYVAARLLGAHGQPVMDDYLIDPDPDHKHSNPLIDLREVLLMATKDAGVALQMLTSLFNEDLQGPYRRSHSRSQH